MLRLLDTIFVCYFLSHIPTTLIMDASLVLPASLYPDAIRDTQKWYVSTFKDPFMNPVTSPLWFKSFIWAELFIQVPLFLACAYGIYRSRSWVRLPSMIYAAHVMTTMMPILTLLLVGVDKDFYPAEHRPDTQATRILLGFYTPYFIIPFMLFMRMIHGGGLKDSGKGKRKLN